MLSGSLKVLALCLLLSPPLVRSTPSIFDGVMPLDSSRRLDDAQDCESTFMLMAFVCQDADEVGGCTDDCQTLLDQFLDGSTCQKGDVVLSDAFTDDGEAVLFTTVSKWDRALSQTMSDCEFNEDLSDNIATIIIAVVVGLVALICIGIIALCGRCFICCCCSNEKNDEEARQQQDLEMQVPAAQGNPVLMVQPNHPLLMALGGGLDIDGAAAWYVDSKLNNPIFNCIPPAKMAEIKPYLLGELTKLLRGAAYSSPPQFPSAAQTFDDMARQVMEQELEAAELAAQAPSKETRTSRATSWVDAAAVGPVPGAPPPPPDSTWTKAFDQASGYPYWVNNATGESSWSDPSMAAPPPPPYNP